MNKNSLLIGAFALLFAGVGAWQAFNMQSEGELSAAEKDLTEEEQIEKYFNRKTAKYTNALDRDEYFRKMLIRPGEDAPGYKPGYLYREYTKAVKNMKRSQNEWPWVERGPGNIAGRTRSFLVSQKDASGSTWFAGTASGGVWRTEDAGQTWTHVTAGLPSQIIGSIGQGASNPDVIYAGTGEGPFAGSLTGVGIMKSTDHGNTWTVLESTAFSADFSNVTDLLVDPSDENHLFATTSNGSFDLEFNAKIMESTDGGNSWTQVYQPRSQPLQIEADPTDFNTLYASIRFDGIVKSTDGGASWSLLGLQDIAKSQAAAGTELGRTAFAISPADPQRLYASVHYDTNGPVFSRFFTSGDGGGTWSVVERSGDQITNDYLGISGSPQGFYNNCIVAHPDNANKVYWGGIDLWKTELNIGSIRLGDRQFLGARTNNISSWLDFTQFSSSAGLESFEEFVWGGTEETGRALVDTRIAQSIEIRFGAGRSQKAHRFRTDPVGAGAGVADEDYIYQDYTDVPFEVYSLETGNQLMVSYRDQADNGQWDLVDRPEGDNTTSREYIFIHGVDYDASNPDPNIARDGGVDYQDMYFLWPFRADGSDVTADNLPESSLAIVYGNLEFQDSDIQNVSNGYPFINDYGERNDLDELHVDHHVLATTTNDSGGLRLVVGNDGGVAYSDNDGDSWTEIDDISNLNTTQYYSISRHPSSNVYIGGAQDNGTSMSIGASPGATSGYDEVAGGDGTGCVWHAEDPNLILVSSQNNNILRSSNGGGRFLRSVSGLRDLGGNAPFVTKIANSHKAPDVVFAGGASGVWKSTNFGSSWRGTNINDDLYFFGQHLAVSDADPNIVWVGIGMIEGTANLFVSTDQGGSFNRTDNFIDRDMGAISGIYCHPTKPNTAFAIFSQAQGPKILRTDDLGRSWDDVTGFGINSSSSNGFPDVAVYSMAVLPGEVNGVEDEIFIAGTEIGLFISEDAGSSWSLADNGIPNVPIYDIDVMPQDGQIVFGTYGRGMWSADLDIEYADVEEPTDDTDGTDDSPTDVRGFFSGTNTIDVNVFPNPTADRIKFELPEGKNYDISVFNLSGQQVISSTSKGGITELKLGNFASGTYVLKATDGDKVYTQKVVLRK